MSNQEVDDAKNIFRYLAEVKKLSSPSINDYEKYDQVVWINDIPREKGCYTKVWEVIGQPTEVSRDSWIEIEKPVLTAPPELPDGLDIFVNEKEWRDSSCEAPSLLDVSRELLIRHFLPDEDAPLEYESISINENNHIFSTYAEYVDSHWRPWSEDQSKAKEPISLPTPPEELIPWLDPEKIQDHLLDEPPLLEEISVEIDTRFEEAKQKLKTDFRTYLDKKWFPWAEEDRKQQRIQKIYNQLYSAYQRRQKLGEQYELILGFGLLVWQGPKSQRVRRHVLTAEAAITFDTKRGMIIVHAPPDGASLAAEDDMLHTDERPQPTEKTSIDQSTKDVGNGFLDQAVLSDLLKSFVNALQYKEGETLINDGQFDFSLERPVQATRRPQINLAPAIILRKRSQRGFIRLLEEVREFNS